MRRCTTEYGFCGGGVYSVSHQELFDQCTKDQLLKIAEHFEIEITDKKLKETVRVAVKDKLIEDNILVTKEVSKKSLFILSVRVESLTFEQQK